MKKLVAVMMILALTMVSVVGCGTSGKTPSNQNSNAKARTLQEIKDSGKITIGVFTDKKPFGYVDSNGDYQGYDVYFGNQIGTDLGVKVEYVPVDAAARAEYLVSAKVDLILANFTVTKERAEKVDFTLPYMKVALGIVSPDSNLITDASQLNGKTLIVCKGTTAETYFSENFPEIKLLKFDQYSEAYNALLDGRGDALSTDNTEVLAWALENKGFTVGVESLGNIDTIAGAVQKGNQELLNWINEEMKTLGKDNFFHKAYEETLAPVYGEAASADNLVVEGGVVE